MKTTIPIILAGFLMCSCTERRSFHTEVLDHHLCEATYFLVDGKLDEVASIFTAEFDHLQRSASTETNLRAHFLYYAGTNFPESRVWKLEPLFRKGCEDPNPTVRRMAMDCVTHYLKSDSTNILKDISQHSRPEVRDDILQYLQKRAEAAKQ